MAEEIENLDSPNQEVIVPENEPEPGLPADPVEVEPVETIENDDTEAVKEQKRINQELYEQLRKAKGFKRDPKTGKWVKPESNIESKVDKTSSDITIMELKSLLAANINDDADTEEVRLYARSHKMSITEALKVPEVKSMLKTRIEMRKTAEVANIRNSRFGVQKPSDEQVLADAREGKLADASTLAEIRDRERLAKIKR